MTDTTEIRALAATTQEMANFYSQRPNIDEQEYVPGICEISRRECLEVAILLRKAASALPTLAAERDELERQLADARTVMLAARLYLYAPQTASWQFEAVVRDVDKWLASRLPASEKPKSLVEKMDEACRKPVPYEGLRLPSSEKKDT